MPDMHEQPAGWYRDPAQPNLHRYWSGQRWSDWLGEERWSGDTAAQGRPDRSSEIRGDASGGGCRLAGG